MTKFPKVMVTKLLVDQGQILVLYSEVILGNDWRIVYSAKD